MRKGLLIVMAFLCSILAQADGVSREAALEKARAFLKTKGVGISQRTDAVSAPRRKAGQQEEACYYVFNADRGYVIVSGDDRTVPILGYSLTGSYDPDNIPANMRAWLQSYADQIEALDSLDVTTQYEATDSIGCITKNKSGMKVLDDRQMVMSNQVIAPLLKSKWNQSAPYSSLIYGYYDDDDGVRHYGFNVTGCVATAMAQVMYYHRWPAAVTTEIPSYTTKTNGFSIDAIPAGTPFDWDGMADSYPDYPYLMTEAEYLAMIAETGHAVSDLMLACGVSVEMDYDINESGAPDALVAPALKKYFDYDPNLYTAHRSDYTISQWNSLLLQELMNNRPIIYGGQSNGGGHEFVIDGYDGSELFHVNWGWGGVCNGYFAISVLNPHSTEGTGASSSSDGYSMMQSAVIGVQPAGADTPMPPVTPSNQLTVENLHIVDNRYLVCDIWNFTESEGVFYFGYVSFDANNNIRLHDYLQTPQALPPGYGYANVTFDLNEFGLTAGTYKLYPIGIKNNIQDLLNGSISLNMERYILVTVGDDQSVTVEQHPIVNLEATSFILPEDPGINVEQTIKATIVNTGEEYNGNIFVFAAPSTTEEASLVQTSGTAIPEGGSCEMEIYFTPTEETDYDIYVATDKNGANIIGRCVLTLVKEPVVDLEVVSVSPYNAPVVNEEYRFRVTVRNNGDDYSGPLQLFHASETKFEQETTVWTGQGRYIQIAAGETLDFDYEFTPDETGTYYFWFSTSSEDQNHLISQHVIEVAAPQSDILGDVNGDGRVNVADITLLSKYISNSDPTGVRTANCDLTGDGRITVADVVELARTITSE